MNLSIQSYKLVTNGMMFINLIKDIYDHCVVMHMKFRRMSLVIEELLPFDYLNLN